jgi:hypothetical protein
MRIEPTLPVTTCEPDQLMSIEPPVEPEPESEPEAIAGASVRPLPTREQDTRANLLAASLERLANRSAELRDLALEGLVRTQPVLVAARELARLLGKTVVIGVGLDRVPLPAGSVSGGIFFGPTGEMGVTGSIALGATLTPSPSATVQMLLLDGGPELLRGAFSMASIQVGEALVGGGARVYDAEGDGIGYMVEMGAGLAPSSPISLAVTAGFGHLFPLVDGDAAPAPE